MEDHPLIADMRKKAASQNEYDKFAALLFALQIPSICSRIEIPQTPENTSSKQDNPMALYKPNGKPWDKNLYFAWLRKHYRKIMQLSMHSMPFETLCESIYNLRNNITHSGNLLELDSQIVFVDSNTHEHMTSSGVLYTSVLEFCRILFDAAKGVSLDNISLHFLTNTKYEEIKDELTKKCDMFWAGRDDDLRLYQVYCFGMVGSIDQVEQHLKDNPEWTTAYLTRAQLERLVEVVHEVDNSDIFDKFNEEIAKK